jgi:hypothetical protein
VKTENVELKLLRAVQYVYQISLERGAVIIISFGTSGPSLSSRSSQLETIAWRREYELYWFQRVIAE